VLLAQALSKTMAEHNNVPLTKKHFIVTVPLKYFIL